MPVASEKRIRQFWTNVHTWKGNDKVAFNYRGKSHLLFGCVLTKDWMADQEVTEGNNGHRNKLIPKQCWENG